MEIIIYRLKYKNIKTQDILILMYFMSVISIHLK